MHIDIDGVYNILEKQREFMITALCVNLEKNPINIELVLDIIDNIDFETMFVKSSVSNPLGSDYDD